MLCCGISASGTTCPILKVGNLNEENYHRVILGSGVLANTAENQNTIALQQENAPHNHVWCTLQFLVNQIVLVLI